MLIGNNNFISRFLPCSQALRFAARFAYPRAQRLGGSLLFVIINFPIYVICISYFNNFIRDNEKKNSTNAKKSESLWVDAFP